MADEPTDAPSTARERRRSRAAARKPAAGPILWRRYKVHLIIVLIFGGIATAMAVNASSTKDCPGHWHSSMDVYVNGERISFDDPKFTLEGAKANGGSMSFAAHMHSGEDYLWHWEPQGGADCVAFRSALRHLDLEITSSRIVLDDAHEQLGQAGTFAEDAEHNLTAWHRIGDGEWESVSVSSLLGRQHQPDERALFVYGNQTEDEVLAYKATADSHTIQGSSGAQTASMVPVFGVSLLGLVVLGGWHALSRKA